MVLRRARLELYVVFGLSFILIGRSWLLFLWHSFDIPMAGLSRQNQAIYVSVSLRRILECQSLNKPLKNAGKHSQPMSHQLTANEVLQLHWLPTPDSQPVAAVINKVASSLLNIPHFSTRFGWLVGVRLFRLRINPSI